MKQPAAKSITDRCRERAERLFKLLTVAVLVVAVQPAQGREYILSVVPQLALTQAHSDWSPFVERLSTETTIPIRLRVYRTFEEFETDLSGGVPDFVYLNPYHQVMARRNHGYLPLVRDGSRKLSGTLVVRNDSPVKTVKDLNGQTIGFPDPNAFAASLYMRAMLLEKEKITFHPHFFITHGNVYRHVIVGNTAAGAGVNLTLEHERPELRAALRILYVTPGTAPHPLSAHPRVTAVMRNSVQQAVLRMWMDESGRELLKKIQIHHPIVADYNRDYAPLEKLRLDKHWVTTRMPTR